MTSDLEVTEPRTNINRCRSLHDNGIEEAPLDPLLSSSTSSFRSVKHGISLRNRAIMFCSLIVILGAAAAAAFVGIGVAGANRVQDQNFDRRAFEIVNAIATSWGSYEVAGLYVHEACRDGCTRQRFKEAYEYIASTGLVFQAASYNPNTTLDGRKALESESRAFYGEFFPEINYTGIRGLEPDPNNRSNLSVQARSIQSYYFPVHYLEPVRGNEAAIDFDLYSSSSRRMTIHTALEGWQPALTPRLKLVQETTKHAYSVILLHPGVPLSFLPNLQTKDLSSIVVRIPDLITDATKSQREAIRVFIYDTTVDDKPPEFLGGATLNVDPNGAMHRIFEEEIELKALRDSVSSRASKSEVATASSLWTIYIIAVDGTYEASVAYIILGGVFILAACIFLAIWLYSNMRRQAKISRIEAVAEAEKAVIVIENAQRSAIAERELNDFIAHEVRNPLSAAMSACNFVGSAIKDETKSLEDPPKKKAVLDDVDIIEKSLSFINDLLRNMLDMQRAKSDQLRIEWAPTDIKRDILLPVDSMLYSRASSFETMVDCPENLIVLTDRMRLKQILINLGRNATKFVDKGFVKIGAAEVDGEVALFIEDSGPGIPEEKRERMFAKFQESLDSLNQGTGIGLSLCKKLVDLMGAEIVYDDTYDSGIKGCPGSRFEIKLNRPRLEMSDLDLSARFDSHSVNSDSRSILSDAPEILELPENLNVLFVDDDLVLRKLFTRAINKVAPGWNVEEAANGESALRSVDEMRFDLIFMDQYMTSVEKQLLGTEATLALRAKGVTSRICGLSANDVEDLFLDAGADAFMFKPFPCSKEALTNELLRVLFKDKTLVEP